ncbi:PhnD/SsuA/transferrin family substrate-binding protein [Ensifer sp. ENS06]|nr:PhnD/SsuA/transferrin family substrate-binding protein [Ensifer sp. ENS06]
MQPIAALPMYDWPEVRDEVDQQWRQIRDKFRSLGINAPDMLVRSHKELPGAPDGILDTEGKVIAADPATLYSEGLDPRAIWMHPALLFAQTCWGPMHHGLAKHVKTISQPNYGEFEGGNGEFYSSAIVMRAGEAPWGKAPSNGRASIPLEFLRDRRFTFNDPHSMSGLLGLVQDLEAMGETLEIFSERIPSGGHRESIKAIAAGHSDVAAIDCKSFALAQQFEPAAKDVTVVGWTSQRKGLPFITSRHTSDEIVLAMRTALETLPGMVGAREMRPQ